MKDGRPYGVNYRHLCAEADVKNCFISGSRQRCAEYSSTDTKASTALGSRGGGGERRLRYRAKWSLPAVPD